MADRDFQRLMLPVNLSRARLNAFRVSSPDVPEARHLCRCEACGQIVDRRQLGDVLLHEEPGHSRTAEGLRFIKPMMPILIEEPPVGSEWQHEIKYDGYRTQLVIDGGLARAFTRNGHDWTERYPGVVRSAEELFCASAVLDGEIILQDEQGRSDFQAINSIRPVRHQRYLQSSG